MHSDVWRSFIVSHLDFWHYVIFVDNYSSFTWFYPNRWKNEVFLIFTNVKTRVENQFRQPTKFCQRDGWIWQFRYVESISTKWNSFSKILSWHWGSIWCTERKHCHLLEMVSGFFYSSSFTISILGWYCLHCYFHHWSSSISCSWFHIPLLEAFW